MAQQNHEDEAVTANAPRLSPSDVPHKYRTRAISDLDLEERRAARAHTEPMLVLPDAGEDGEAIGLYSVISGSGSEYTADPDLNRCDCPDFRHNAPPACKHVLRVQADVEAGVVPAEGGNVAAYMANFATWAQWLDERITALKAILTAAIEYKDE